MEERTLTYPAQRKGEANNPLHSSLGVVGVLSVLLRWHAFCGPRISAWELQNLTGQDADASCEAVPEGVVCFRPLAGHQVLPGVGLDWVEKVRRYVRSM